MYDFFKKKQRAFSPKPSLSFLGHGQQIPIFGKLYTIVHSKSLTNRVAIEGDFLVACIRSHSFSHEKLITDFLKKTLYEKVVFVSHMYAKMIDKEISHISVKKMRSRWGSCSSNGRLSYALNLVFASEEAILYICAHEVAHLKHMNHSHDFWGCVHSVFPRYKIVRKWLKLNGAGLFVYDVF
jgi:hypothetical protein